MIRKLNILIAQNKFVVLIFYSLLLVYFFTPIIQFPISQPLLGNCEINKSILVDDITIIFEKLGSQNQYIHSVKELKNQKISQFDLNESAFVSQQIYFSNYFFTSEPKNSNEFYKISIPRSPPTIIS